MSDFDCTLEVRIWMAQKLKADKERAMTEQIDFDEAYEPDWDSLKDVNYACGHPGLVDRCEDDPGPGDVCWGCHLCSGCGRKNSECVCVWHDPFAEESA